MILSLREQRTSGIKTALLSVVCLAFGLAAGWWARGRGRVDAKTWEEAAELYQMYKIPSSYNFVESNKGYESELLALLHDQLLHFDPVQNQLVAGLARTWEVSPDGLTWTFHLREAQTPDGVKLTAEDVVFSVGLCLDTRFDCKKRGNLIQKGRPVVVKAVAPLTVTFGLGEPYHSFAFAMSGVPIVPKATFAAVAGDEKEFRRAVGVQQPELKYLRGFGPFCVESQDTQEVRLVRNDRFWGRGDEQSPRPNLSRITLALRGEDATGEMDFNQDDRFVYRLVGPMEAQRLREDPRFQVLDRGLSGWCMFFWVNQNPGAPWGRTYPKRLALFQNVAFRRALAHAIDRHAIIHRAFHGAAEPLYGPVSPVYRWAAPSETLLEVTPSYDRAAALAGMAKLGVTPGEPDGDGKRWLSYEENGKRVPLEIEIRTSRDEEDRRRKTAEEIKAQLAEIGLRVKVVEERFGDVVTRLDKTYDYEAAVMFLNGHPDAATLRYFFVSSGPMHFVNPYQKSPATEWEKKVDDLFGLYAASPDAAVRERSIIELQKTWVSAQPAIHLVNDRKLVAVRRDWEVNGMALTGRASDPILSRTVIEGVRLRHLTIRK
jgi:peptide/nickel transport system substrate-binding protein